MSLVTPRSDTSPRLALEVGIGCSSAGEPEMSAKLARRGCEARDSESCVVYASDKVVGYGVPVDAAAGTALFERVCGGTGSYGPQRMEQRCWWAVFRMRLTYK